MSASVLADGVTSVAGERLATLAVKCLAVGGGLLVGYFLGAVIAWALDRWLFAEKAPAQLKKLVSYVAGLALAIVVALIVFGEGGKGLFGGGAQGEGTGTPSPDKNEKKEPGPPPVTTPTKHVETPKTEEPTPPSKPADALIDVTILGGSDVPGDERFYLTDDSSKPKTFEELKQYVLARKQQEKGTVGLALHFRSKNAPSLDPPHYSITQLTKWAKDTAKLDVTFAAPK
jgi:hypothetical protein